MVFPECSLKEGDAGFIRKSRQLVDMINVIRSIGKLLDSLVKVLNDLQHDISAGITSLVEHFIIARADGSLIIRDISESLDLVEIEHCAEEMGDTLILGACRGIFAAVAILEEIIDITKFLPFCGGPSVRGIRGDRTLLDTGERSGHMVISCRVSIIVGAAELVDIEIIGP